MLFIFIFSNAIVDVTPNWNRFQSPAFKWFLHIYVYNVVLFCTNSYMRINI